MNDLDTISSYFGWPAVYAKTPEHHLAMSVAEQGNYENLSVLLKQHPEWVWLRDETKYMAHAVIASDLIENPAHRVMTMATILNVMHPQYWEKPCYDIIGRDVSPYAPNEEGLVVLSRGNNLLHLTAEFGRFELLGLFVRSEIDLEEMAQTANLEGKYPQQIAWEYDSVMAEEGYITQMGQRVALAVADCKIEKMKYKIAFLESQLHTPLQENITRHRTQMPISKRIKPQNQR